MGGDPITTERHDANMIVFFQPVVAHKIDKSNFNVVCLLDGWTEKLPGRSGRILSMWGINHISMCVFLGKMVAKKNQELCRSVGS